MLMIPKELRSLFWDIQTDELDPRQHPEYVIGRILELGTEPAVKWMMETFSDGEIKKVIREDRHLSPRSANYWALIYRIPRTEVAALSGLPATL